MEKGAFMVPFFIAYKYQERRFMDLLDNKSDKDLLLSLLAEIAKAQNELRCAQNDLNKATNRIKFCVVLSNTLINRQKD